MGRTKCSICGGPVLEGRCRECGMIYRDERSLYRLNESLGRAAEQPEPQRKREDRKQNSKQRIYEAFAIEKPGEKPAKEASKKTNYTGFAVAAISILLIVVPAALDFYEESESETFEAQEEFEFENEGDVSVAGETYAEGLPAFSENGEVFDASLEAGCYRVGWQIPEGIYTLRAQGDESVFFSLEDEKNGIWLSETLTQREDFYGVTSLSNVRLYEGAVIELDGPDPVLFETASGDTAAQAAPIQNPASEQRELDLDGGNGSISGVPEGYYDVEGLEGWGALCVVNGEEEVFSIFLGSEDSGSPRVFYNIFIPEGSEVRLEEEYSSETFRVSLASSRYIYE